MCDPFVGRKKSHPRAEEARGEAIEARLRGLSIDELMRGGGFIREPTRVVACKARIIAATIPMTARTGWAAPTAENGPMVTGGPVIR